MLHKLWNLIISIITISIEEIIDETLAVVFNYWHCRD